MAKNKKKQAAKKSNAKSKTKFGTVNKKSIRNAPEFEWMDVLGQFPNVQKD